jgi:parallel beta-helix repeat protein
MGATRVASPGAVPWSTLPAGSLVLISAGTYAGITTVTSVGTAANPIVVTAYDPANPPVLSDSVDFQGAAWVQVSHLTVQAPTYAGFIIRKASHHLTVSDTVVNKAFAGVNITDAAGTGHRILRNTFADSVVDGINAEVNASAAERTLIQYNTIVRSGVHGIEVRASHYQVEYNTVSASGQTSGGASGIHVFSGSASEDSGDDNLIRYNASYANLDTRAYDGNGIEIDQWCDANTVAFNQVWGNDGAGIIVYDGSSNVLQNNTAWNDGVDSGHMMAARAEIVVSGTSASTVAGNRVWNNVAESTRASVSALYVDPRAVGGGNTIGANLLYNAAGGTVLRWTDSATRQTAALIDAITGTPGNVVAAPAFANTAAPLSAGLRLTALPSLHGVLPTGLLDLAGTAPVSGESFFGAYYTSP